MTHLHHKISQLVDGDLRGSARQRALHHIAGCGACKKEYEDTLALKRRLLGAGRADPPERLSVSLGHVVELPLEASASRGSLLRTAKRLIVGAGSMSAAVLSLAYIAGAPHDDAGPAVVPPVEEYTADFAFHTADAPLADLAIGASVTGFNAIAWLAGSSRAELPYHSADVRSGGRTEGRAAAIALLTRAVEAPSKVSYAGVREVDGDPADGSVSVKLHVIHTPRQGTSFVVEGLSGVLPSFVAQNDVTSELGADTLRALLSAYQVSVEGSATVAQRPATVVAASYRGVVAARFYIDDKTGLLLRRVLYDQGRIVRSSEFVSLSVNHRDFISHLGSALQTQQSSPVGLQSAQVLDDQGWGCPAVLARTFRLIQLRQLDTFSDDADVVRADYSDGLSTASVFEQRGSLATSGLAGFDVEHVAGGTVEVSYGLPTVAVWQSGDMVYTLVTDAPSATAAELWRGLPEPSASSTSVDTRIATGFHRIGHFLDPVN